MDLSSFKIENFSLTLDYYNILKAVSENILNYIKNYKLLSLQYNKKLVEISTDYKNTNDKILSEIKAKKLDLLKPIHFINSIQHIIETYNENLLLLTEEIDKEIKVYESLNPELIVPTCIEGFKGLKEKIIQKEKELNNIKNNFFDEMSNTEDIIYKFYSSNSKNKIEAEDLYKNDKNQKDIITEEEVNNKIINAKKLEEKYKKGIEEGKKAESDFIKFSKFYSESVKKMVGEMFEKLKHFILNFLISIKNNFKIPQTEIDVILPELVKLDSSLKLEKVLEKYYHDESKYKSLFDFEEYILKDFRENQNNNNIKTEKKKISIIEDGYDKLIFIGDENLLLTVKKIKNNFELVNINKLDLKIEEEKMEMKKLMEKLFTNLLKEKNCDKINPDIINITNEEIKNIEVLLEKHHTLAIFIQQLNKFRSTGRYVMNEKIYELLGKLFNLALNKTQKDNDFSSAKNIIILSQTYYYRNENKKEYLQNKIYNHELLRSPKFWEDLFVYEMSKEIQKVTKIDLKNSIEAHIEFDSEYNKIKFSNLAFGQIMTLSNNMLEFGLSPKLIYQVMEPKIKYYQLSQKSVENIKSLIGLSNEEINNSSNDKEINNKENQKNENEK